MVKSSAPVWVLLSAFIFGLEQITCNLILVGLLITAGEILTAFGEVEFDTIGFILVLSAAICGGIRWTLVQFKLQHLDPPLGGPVVTMRVLSSTMFFSMLLMSFIIEKPWIALDRENGDYFSTFENGSKTILTGLAGALIAIAMVLCEFWLILKSNAIVLMIGGVLKEMITIFVGVTAFGDNLNVINVSGIVVVFLGVLLYKITFHLANSEKENKVTSATDDSSHFSRLSSSDINDSFVQEKRKNSDADLALTYKIDDDMDADHDMDEDISNHNIDDGMSPLRERIALEVDEREGNGII